MSAGYLPIVLRAGERPCLVVGGGEVAQRKVAEAREAGFRVVVVAPLVSPYLEALAGEGSLVWRKRPFQPADLEGVGLVYAAATPEVNREVARAARAAGVLVNVVDAPEMSDFLSPAVCRRGPIALAVSTGGASPTLAARLRDRLASFLGEEVAEWAELLERFRQQARARWPEGPVRRELLRQAGELDGASLIAQGRRQALETLLASWLEAGRCGRWQDER